MRLATPAVPREWRLERSVDGDARLVIQRKAQGWAALAVTMLMFWLLTSWPMGSSWRPLALRLFLIAASCVPVIQIADLLAHRALGQEVWHFTPHGLQIRTVVFGITWRYVHYPEGKLVVECREGAGWALQFHDGVTGYTLHQSHDLEEVLGLAAFLEDELGWPLRSPASSPHLFRQLLELALAKQDGERIRLLMQAPRAITVLVRTWTDWAPAFRPRLRESLLALELETGFLSRLAGQAGSEAQAAAVELLGELGSAHACAALRTALETSAGAVRVQAARALGRLQDREAVPALCSALQYAPALRDAAVQALGEIRDPAALPALLELLHGSAQVSESSSRLMVIAALGRIKDPAAVPALEGVLRCGILELREAAIHALGEIGGPHVIAPLASVLTDLDARIAVRAALSLGQLREPAAWRALAGARAKGHLEVRVRAVRALIELETQPRCSSCAAPCPIRRIASATRRRPASSASPARAERCRSRSARPFPSCASGCRFCRWSDRRSGTPAGAPLSGSKRLPRR